MPPKQILVNLFGQDKAILDIHLNTTTGLLLYPLVITAFQIVLTPFTKFQQLQTMFDAFTSIQYYTFISR